LPKISNKLKKITTRDKLNDDFTKQLTKSNSKIETLEESFVNEEIKVDLYGQALCKV
jgi:hypothetical protein